MAHPNKPCWVRMGTQQVSCRVGGNPILFRALLNCWSLRASCRMGIFRRKCDMIISLDYFSGGCRVGRGPFQGKPSRQTWCPSPSLTNSSARQSPIDIFTRSFWCAGAAVLLLLSWWCGAVAQELLVRWGTSPMRGTNCRSLTIDVPIPVKWQSDHPGDKLNISVSVCVN